LATKKKVEKLWGNYREREMVVFASIDLSVVGHKGQESCGDFSIILWKLGDSERVGKL